MSRRVVQAVAMAFLCLVAGISLESCAFTTESDEVWFDHLLSAPLVTQEEAENLAQFAAQNLFKGKETSALPERWREDTISRILFISLSDGTSLSHVVRGSGQGLGDAVMNALEQAREWIASGHTIRWMKLDVVLDVSLFIDVYSGSPQNLPRSVYGLAFDQPSGLAWLPEELVAHTLMNSSQKLRFNNMEKYLIRRSAPVYPIQRLGDLPQLNLFRFKTASYFSDGTETVRLYRGHRLFRKITGDEMRSAAVAGGKYLTAAVAPDGKFVYSYLPKTDAVADDYNILRHGGTLYSMLELYELTTDPALLQAAERALDYLMKAVLPCNLGGRSHVCIVEGGEVKLGGNGLAAVALAKYIEVTGDQRHISDLVAWGQSLLALQRESGAFIHKITYPEGEDTGFVSEYYPGEALLALVRIYGQDPREGWLDAAEKGAQYLINVRDQGLSAEALAHDHWLLYALNELYRHRQNPLYLEHAMRIVQAILGSQNLEPEYPDWLGSYYKPPRSTPTATRTEGLCAAYQLARDFPTPIEADQILKAMGLGIAFQLQTQFRPESAMYIRDPQRSLGGFHSSLTNFRLRIDYTQHNISSLLCVAGVLSEAVPNPGE